MPRTKKSDTTPAAAPKKTTRKPRTKKSTTKLDFKKYYESIRANISANKQKYSRYLIVAGIILLVAVFAFLKKDWFVVAVVNRQPITTIEFYQNLKSRNGEEVLTQIIRDKLIMQEADRQGVTASQDEIDTKVKEVEDQLGGREQLLAALEQSNLSEEDFRTQVKIQLLVEKILEDEIQISDEEVEEYIAQNPDDPIVAGSDDAVGPNREEIREQLKSNKLNERFASWYEELEKNSSVLRFID